MVDTRFSILLVEDDSNDVLLIKRALLRSGVENPLFVAPDGEKAILYLTGSKPFGNERAHPLPGLILTDLKMPRVDGLDLLRWIKGSSICRFIPTVVLTSSTERHDILGAYALGANSYIVKPASGLELREILACVVQYWKRCETAIPQTVSSGQALETARGLDVVHHHD